MSWLLEQCNVNPDSNYIQSDKISRTYYELNEMVQVYAQSLIRENIKFQDIVLIVLDSDIDLVEIIFSCFEIGAIALPISPIFKKNEFDNIINNVKPEIIITKWKYKSQFLHRLEPVSYIEELPQASRGCAIIKNIYVKNLDHIAAIILTSGTTGTPKAVQLTYGNFEKSCNNWHDFLNFRNTDQFLCCLPLHHIGGLAVLIRAVIYGFSVNLIKHFEPRTILVAMQQCPVTIISLVPTMIKRIIEIDGGIDILKFLRWILLGGGPSPEKLLNICIQNKLNIVKVYGMTETCSGTIGMKLLEEPENKLYAGRPFSDTKVWSKNDELFFSGPMVMRGYLGEDDSNSVHNSHDLGYIDKDKNNLVYLDTRRKDLIVTGGKNVNPIEVEERLVEIEEILDAAVVPIQDDEWGQIVAAYIVGFDNKLISSNYLKKILEEKLSSFKIPKKFIQISFIPRNEIGKIQYSKLEENKLQK